MKQAESDILLDLSQSTILLSFLFIVNKKIVILFAT